MKKCSAFIVLLMLCFYSCKNQDHKVYSNWNGGYINSLGKYIIEKEHIMLSVSGKDGILVYDFSVNSDTLFKSNENASVYQDWFLYLDKSRNVWVESSDVGTWVWCRCPNDKYKKFNINDRPAYCKTIPEQFLDPELRLHKNIK